MFDWRPTVSAQQSVEQWLDAFFDLYFRANPVSATCIGNHEHDRTSPLGSSSSSAPDGEALLGDLEGGRVSEPADDAQELDLLLAGAFLRTAQLETESGHV